jgi:hypothetical protein
MWESAWIFVTAITILILGGAAVWPFLRARHAARSVQQALETFHRRREWLEARFLCLAEKSGKPRGLRWVDCEFDDHVEFARDRATGHFRALVGVTIRFEAIQGEGMEDVEAVRNLRAATAVFRLDGAEWETDGRACFNLSPSQTIQHFHSELEPA